jgi:hypothetical protein
MDFLGQDGRRGACPLRGILRGQGGQVGKGGRTPGERHRGHAGGDGPAREVSPPDEVDNMQERLIQEVRRRERVIGIFPNEESTPRLVGALLAEINSEWQERRYLDMSEFYEWFAERQTGKPQDNRNWP